MEEEIEAPPELERLVTDLKQRFEFVVTLKRHGPDDMDTTDKQAFAFVIGGDSDNALIIEGGVSGDGRDAHATVWGLTDGVVTTPTHVELDGRLAASLPIPQ